MNKTASNHAPIFAMIAVTGIYPVIDPDTKRRFEPGAPVEVELTKWVQGQVDAGNMVNSSPEAVAAAAERKAAEAEQAQQLLDDKTNAQNTALNAGAGTTGTLAADDKSGDSTAVASSQAALADATASPGTKLGESNPAGNEANPGAATGSNVVDKTANTDTAAPTAAAKKR